MVCNSLERLPSVGFRTVKGKPLSAGSHSMGAGVLCSVTSVCDHTRDLSCVWKVAALAWCVGCSWSCRWGSDFQFLLHVPGSGILGERENFWTGNLFEIQIPGLHFRLSTADALETWGPAFWHCSRPSRWLWRPLKSGSHCSRQWRSSQRMSALQPRKRAACSVGDVSTARRGGHLETG